MSSPSDRTYSESHEWHKVEGSTLTLGLTKFAVDQLTDVTYVEMKKPGTKFKAGDHIGEVESVKTTSDVYCSCDGEIAEVNQAVVSDPSLLNTDPYGKGWLVKVKIASPDALSKLMNAAAYDKAHGAH
ncbi:MAG: glycine cleavage system protein GcvH [Phycisphaerales bacterium]